MTQTRNKNTRAFHLKRHSAVNKVAMKAAGARLRQRRWKWSERSRVWGNWTGSETQNKLHTAACDTASCKNLIHKPKNCLISLFLFGKDSVCLEQQEINKISRKWWPSSKEMRLNCFGFYPVLIYSALSQSPCVSRSGLFHPCAVTFFHGETQKNNKREREKGRNLTVITPLTFSLKEVQLFLIQMHLRTMTWVADPSFPWQPRQSTAVAVVRNFSR